ncbi:MAG: tRNA (cytidine(34)-2'-O)-methyltransferase [Pseudomonadota bacterium]
MTDQNTAKAPISVVLFQPDIPGNTGTILRLAACFDLTVHVIGPAGFRLDDASLQRAGMDYLERASLVQHVDWVAFQAWHRQAGGRVVVFSTFAEDSYTEFQYQFGDLLMFGRESAGLPDLVHEAADHRVLIRMAASGRSLNLAVSVAMGVGEALRQLG